MTGEASVEPERELIEVVIEMLMRYAALVDAQEPPFQQRRDLMHAGQQGRGGLATPAHHAGPVAIAVVDQAWVGRPAIGAHDRARGDSALYEADEALPRSIRDPLEPDSTCASAPDFRGDGDQRFGLTQVPLALAGLDTAHEDFVHLDRLRQRFPTWPHHGPPQLVQTAPGRLVAAEPQRSLQADGTDPTLLVRDPPDRAKPHPQGQVAVLEDRSSRERDVNPTGPTDHHSAPAHRPALTSSTRAALKPVGPAQLSQIGPARLLRTEAIFKLQQRSRVVVHDPARYHLAGVASSG